MSILSDLLTGYGLVDIILIVFLVAFGIKEILQLWDFFINRNKKKVIEEKQDEDTTEKILEKIGDLEDQVATLYNDSTEAFGKIRETLEEHQSTLDRLIQSDKDDIRADLVKQHHYFLNKGYIDDFSMDAIEKRYGHYKAAGGNSYISDLVHDLRQLPKR